MNNQAEIYCVAAEWLVQPEHVETVRGLLIEAAAAVRRHEPGNLLYIAHESAEEPGRFFVYEQYANQEAQIAHRAAPHFQELVLGRIVPLLAERKTSFYRLLPTQ
ncbi:Quinol monooxygenase YgiN [Hymenobacter daecheongensis DSM 21074]|uniref:Quinol monooxygenase YgiN n=1 Tax=Hymenobacter daecheongensis DSM 21074 TaxID=1121955 RepID=A0A1M6FAZ4_9BACT|nr:putative quinol monooxygenase [Hymenobacter daecheongensis]SHI94779.1 Quinol monooxygenase YgiN [Hymenobacter daecheongensis DSM 21074]